MTESEIKPDSVALTVIEKAAEGEDTNREIIFKVIGDRSAPTEASSNVKAVQDAEQVFVGQGAIEAPYPPESLCQIFEHSNSLRQNVDAYATNIDGFGFRLDPLIDFDSEDADAQIAEALFIENGGARDPSEGEVKAKKDEIRRSAKLEHAQLMRFFARCAFDISFTTLRKRTRQDKEVQGNAYWEILRTRSGAPSRFVQVPAQTVRLMPSDRGRVKVEEKTHTLLGYAAETVNRRFRRFVQIIDETPAIYFKEFGDPRTISKLTGKVVPDGHAFEGNDGPATEIYHFEIYSPRTPYGIPRWIGNLLSVLGSRSAEEVNYYYFENKSVPPLAILVSGGRLAEEAIGRLEDFVKENLQGSTKNFHKIMLLEAESGTGSPSPGSVKIEIKPLTDAISQEELFSKYDERNIDKVGESFRLPRLLRGQSKDFNRATASAALRFAEEQVFQPEREEFDEWINRSLFPALDVRYWVFRSNAPITRDPEKITEMIVKLVEGAVLTPAEGRLLASDVFNHEFREIRATWVRQPIKMTLAGLKSDEPGIDGGGTTEGVGSSESEEVFEAAGGVSETDKQRGGYSRIAAMKSRSERLRALQDLVDTRLSALDDEIMAAEFSEEFDAFEPGADLGAEEE